MTNAGLLDLLVEGLQIARGAVGGGVAPVGDAVDAHLLDAGCRCPAQQTAQVIDVAVNAPIREQPQQMQAAA